jgi:glutamate-1-semialdehyde 2,1-aminomutase
LSAAAGIAMLRIAATGEPQEQIASMGRKMVAEMNRAISELGIEGSCVYGDGPIFHVLLARGARSNPDGTLAQGSAGVVTLRQSNSPPVKAALQRGLMSRGVDLMKGNVGVVATAHTEDDLAQTASAFYETLKEMRGAKLLEPPAGR